MEKIVLTIIQQYLTRNTEHYAVKSKVSTQA